MPPDGTVGLFSTRCQPIAARGIPPARRRASACGHAPRGRHHLLRRAGALGRLGRARRRAPVPLRRAGRGGRRPRGGAPTVGPATTRRAGRASTGWSSPAAPTSTRRCTASAPHPETTGLRPERDAAELPLLRAALDRDLPVLGICRGMQLLPVARGGSLVQHLPDVVGHERHRPAPGVYGLHDVRLAPGSLRPPVLGERGQRASLPPPGPRLRRLADRHRLGRRRHARRSSRTRRGASRSACSGTPRPATTCGCSRPSSPPPANDPPPPRSLTRAQIPGGSSNLCTVLAIFSGQARAGCG